MLTRINFRGIDSRPLFDGIFDQIREISLEIIDFLLDVINEAVMTIYNVYTKIFKTLKIFKLYSFNYLISSIVFSSFSFSLSCINFLLRDRIARFPRLNNPINANMVFLRDVSYPRINQRRTGRLNLRTA